MVLQDIARGGRTLPRKFSEFSSASLTRRFNADLFLLLLVLVFINLPYWDNTVWLSKDTSWVFQIFYAFYNNFFFHGELVRWVPHGAYGIPADVQQLSALTPMCYVAGLAGSLLKVQNTLALFKAALFLEQCVLLFGTYLLARLLFKHRATFFFVTLAVITSAIWHHQIFWNFRFIYCIPLTLYFLLRFRARLRPYDFWLAGVTAVFALMGNLPYYIPVYGVVFLVLTCTLLCERKVWVALWERSARNGVALLCFLLPAGAYVFFAAHATDFTVGYTPHRDPISNAVSLADFMRYGDQIGLVKLLGLLYAGPDKSFFMGILPIPFLVYGLLFARGRVFTAFGLVAVVLFCFMMADNTFIARNAYHYFPLMKMFHHIGALMSVIRLFLILLAGFGLDAFLAAMERQAQTPEDSLRTLHPLHPPNLIWYLAVMLALAMVCIDLFLNHHSERYLRMWPHFYYLEIALTVLVFTLLGLRRYSSVAGMAAIFLMAYGLEMLSFQNFVSLETTRCTAQQATAFRTSEMMYQEQRTADDPQPGTRAGYALELALKTNLPELASYGFMQVDPTVSKYRVPCYSSGVDELFLLRGGKPWKELPANDASFLSMVGSSAPKLRLVSHVIFADTKEQAEKIIHDTPNLENLVVLRGAKETTRAPGNADGVVHVTRFTSNQLEADVTVSSEGTSWLVYADSFHPGWKAFVNGRRVPIVEANLAFKAIALERGKHAIRFVFDYLPSKAAGGTLALLSVVFGAALLGGLIMALTQPWPATNGG